jgi:hypothetical protein
VVAELIIALAYERFESERFQNINSAVRAVVMDVEQKLLKFMDVNRKGGDNMALPKEIEVQRMMNLVRGFGWEKVKEESDADKVRVTLEKSLGEGAGVKTGVVPS